MPVIYFSHFPFLLRIVLTMKSGYEEGMKKRHFLESLLKSAFDKAFFPIDQVIIGNYLLIFTMKNGSFMGLFPIQLPQTLDFTADYSAT